MWVGKNMYKVLLRKHLGKCPRERPRRRWDNSIKGNYGIRYEDRRWVNVVQLCIQTPGFGVV
jgi:hypothetical protein